MPVTVNTGQVKLAVKITIKQAIDNLSNPLIIMGAFGMDMMRTFAVSADGNVICSKKCTDEVELSILIEEIKCSECVVRHMIKLFKGKYDTNEMLSFGNYQKYGAELLLYGALLSVEPVMIILSELENL